MRKVLAETKWRVSLTGDQGMIDKVVDAPSQDVAISRAMRAFPGQQFKHVMANQIDVQSNVPSPTAPAPIGLPRQPQGMMGLKQLVQPGQQLQPQQQESAPVNPRAIQYPYSITLPAQFRRLLHETSPVMIFESNGQYQITIENQKDMKTFLDKLRVNRDRGSAKVIVGGIRSSIS